MTDGIRDDATDWETLADEGERLLREFAGSRDPSLLPAMVRRFDAAARLVPRDDPRRCLVLTCLAEAHGYRYLASDDVAHLETAIAHAREVVAVDDGCGNEVGANMILGQALGSRYRRSGEMSDLEEAIAAARTVLAVPELETRQRSGALSTLCENLVRLYNECRRSSDLEEAIEAGRRAVADQEGHAADRLIITDRLSRALETRFDATGNPDDLDDAISLAFAAEKLVPTSDDAHQRYVNSLGGVLRKRITASGGPGDMHALRTVERRCVDFLRDSGPDPIMDEEIRIGLTEAHFAIKLLELDGGDRSLERFHFRYVMSWVAWCRYLATGGRAERDDARRSFAALRNHPGFIPEELRMELESRSESLTHRAGSAVALFGFHQRTDSLLALEHAIINLEHARDAATDDRADYSLLLTNLGYALSTRGLGQDHDRAIALMESACDYAASPHSEQSTAAAELALATTLVKDQGTSECADRLDRAIAVFDRIDYSRLDGPGTASATLNTCGAYCSRYERDHDPGDLAEAVRFGKAAVIRAGDVSTAAAAMSNLLKALKYLVDIEAGSGQVDDTLRTASGLLSQLGANHPYRADVAYQMAEVYSALQWRDGSLEHLDKAIRLGETALRCLESPRTSRTRMMIALAEMHGRHPRSDGVSRDRAIDLCRRAAETATGDITDGAAAWGILGGQLLQRYRDTGDARDAREAIDALRTAHRLTPRPRANWDVAAWLLAVALRNQPDNLEALDEAIALLLILTDNADTTEKSRAHYLSELCGAFREKYNLTGDLDDLQAAIAYGRRGLDAVRNAADQYTCEANLSVALQSRFVHHHAGPDDLTESIDLGRSALAQTDEPAHQADILANLAIGLQLRFTDDGDLNDLKDGISAGRRALALTPPTHHTYLGRTLNLAHGLRTLTEETAEPSHLNEAIAVSREALSSHGHKDFNLKAHAGLARLHLLRYGRSGSREDLAEAITLASDALARIPEYDPFAANVDITLADALNTALATVFPHARSGDTNTRFTFDIPVSTTSPNLGDAALDSAVASVIAAHGKTSEPGAKAAIVDVVKTLVARAAQSETAAPWIRIMAANRWGRACMTSDDAEAAEGAYTLAVSLLPQLAWRGLRTRDRQSHMSAWTGLAGDAAASAIRAGHPEHAVELLEQGRNVMWGQLLELRGEFGALAAAHPRLAERLETARRELVRTQAFAGEPEDSIGGMTAETGEAAHWAAQRWTTAIAEVRRQAGFEYFQSTPPFAELAAATRDHVAVLVNVSRYGSHALVIHDRRVTPVPLPKLDIETATETAGRFVSSLERLDADTDPAKPGESAIARASARHVVNHILAWLWEAVARPVFTALDIDDGALPRVWWCPTGPLTLLPLHAAGIHGNNGDPGTDTVIDTAISSYTPTLRALWESRNHGSAEVADTDERLLLVAMPNTPGENPLPGTSRETDVLARRFPDSHTRLETPPPTRCDVRTALATHDVVHFACHGTVSPDNPADSGVMLADGVLTVGELSADLNPGRRLAFLSACHTATVTGELADESIHLAAAAQLAGFPHVLATLWAIGDDVTVGVVVAVYAELAKNGNIEVNQCARALHDAMTRLREQGHHPSTWARYIHMGP